MRLKIYCKKSVCVSQVCRGNAVQKGYISAADFDKTGHERLIGQCCYRSQHRVGGARCTPPPGQPSSFSLPVCVCVFACLCAFPSVSPPPSVGKSTLAKGAEHHSRWRRRPVPELLPRLMVRVGPKTKQPYYFKQVGPLSPSYFSLEILEARQQGGGPEVGVQATRRVEEPRLIFHVHGRRFVQKGAGVHRAQL